jgi:hypothetical protein
MKRTVALLCFNIVLLATVRAQTPPVPTGVVAQGFSGSHPNIRVSWQAPLGPWYFILYRSVNDSLHFTSICQLTNRSFEDHGVLVGRTYYYYVKSVVWREGSLVESEPSSIVSATVGSATGLRGTIRGTVVDDSTGAPLRSVRVRFFRQGSNWSEVYDITDSIGRYEAAVDTGRYLLHAEPYMNSGQNYREEWYDNAPDPSAATIVPVGNGSVFTANFGLRRFNRLRTSFINGVVTNEQGQPIFNAQVVVMRSIQEMNYLAATTGTIPGLGTEQRTISGVGYARGVIANVSTDPQGRFRATVPEGGSYIVAAGKSGFYLQYFSHTTDPTRAAIIVAEEDTSGVNFSLRPYSASPNTVRGSVRDSTGSPVPSRVILFPRPPHGGVPTQVVHSDGIADYEFPHVDPGTYIILAVPFSNYTAAFFKDNQYGIAAWQLADSVTVANNVQGVNVGVLSIQSIGLTRVSGSSLSSTGEPLIGGRVVAMNAAGEVVGSGVSTTTGGFALDALPFGQVTLTMDRDPFNGNQVVVNIPPNTFNISNINIILTRSTTSVVEVGPLTSEFRLEQNYPNPFNPATIIRYSLPEEQDVSLKVFDLLGREIATLVDEKQKSGEHSVSFDARALSSGVYYYRLTTGGYVSVKSMVVMK